MKEIGFTINPQKPKYIEVKNDHLLQKMLKVNEQEFERLREFKYLGSTPIEQHHYSNKTENHNGKLSYLWPKKQLRS